jgi:hypothetical protein
LSLSAPALAQTVGAAIDPQADVVNQQTLLHEFRRIQGEINQLDPRARGRFPIGRDPRPRGCWSSYSCSWRS